MKLFLTALLLLPAGASAEPPAKRGKPAWVEPMRKVHARFKGKAGTFAQFGDSITVTMAYWAPLSQPPKKMDPATTLDYVLVKKYLKPECWGRWKGPDYGSNGSMTIRWADDNLDKWLRDHNPEVVLIMFGTNDLGQLELNEYADKTRAVVKRCLKNGSVVILSTIPPRSGQQEKAKKFAAAVRKIAREEGVPLIDYFEECLRRRPDDWDGSLPKFRDEPGGGYEVPTLISRDGVHPSYPARYRDMSPESLRCNGYLLRSYLTLRAYAAVLREVLRPEGGKKP